MSHSNGREVTQWPHGWPRTPTGFPYSTASDHGPLCSNWQSTFNTQSKINNYTAAAKKTLLPPKTNSSVPCTVQRDDWEGEGRAGRFGLLGGGGGKVSWSVAREQSLLTALSSGPLPTSAEPSETAGRAAGYDSRSTQRCREDRQPYLFMPARPPSDLNAQG